MREWFKRRLQSAGLLPLARRLRDALCHVRAAVTLPYDSAAYALAQRWYARRANGLPIPPARLNELVTGARSVSWYVRGGRRSFDSLTACLAERGVDCRRLGSVLDFGCGSGRVIRYWTAFPQAEVHGTDYNPELIRWCRANLPFARFRVNGPRPPLDYPADHFDFVYALSVFTHLDEGSQAAWAAELRRVLKPGGRLLLTVHGDSAFYTRLLGEAERARFHGGRLVVRNGDRAGRNDCAAFHPEAYVRGRLADGFEVLDRLRGGSFGGLAHQDAYLLRKSAAAAGGQSAVEGVPPEMRSAVLPPA